MSSACESMRGMSWKCKAKVYKKQGGAGDMYQRIVTGIFFTICSVTDVKRRCIYNRDAFVYFILAVIGRMAVIQHLFLSDGGDTGGGRVQEYLCRSDSGRGMFFSVVARQTGTGVRGQCIDSDLRNFAGFLDMYVDHIYCIFLGRYLGGDITGEKKWGSPEESFSFRTVFAAGICDTGIWRRVNEEKRCNAGELYGRGCSFAVCHSFCDGGADPYCLLFA